jgi:solute carrier family 13 (sodium-dependent dicarboxylate transporter), member 2/3/5
MKHFNLLFSITVPLIILLIPVEFFPIEELTVIEKRVIAIFVLATLFWVLEPVPIYATSVLIIVLELIMVSNKGFVLFRESPAPDSLGTLLDYKSIFATFASPIILLFMGGFFLAMAATKYRLDKNLARIMLKPFGENPKILMLGLMIITAVFSMFMSNTATTAMMLSILTPVLALYNPTDKGKIAIALSIPVAANIGGIGTPIGTPPNAIALKYLTGENTISFGEWMSFGVPYVVVLLLIAWFLLNMLYPAESSSIKVDIKSTFVRNPKANLVYVTFAGTILLWLTDFLHGMNAYVVAMIPVAVFTTTGIITREDLKKISWDVLWLVSGGIALGLAMDQSGLAKNLVNSIPFGTFSPYIIIGGAALLTLVMANFMSHTATANLLMPILAVLGVSVESLAGLGGISTLILATAISASVGMSLPISTPPNALAHGTGVVSTGDMARIGVIVGIIGVCLAFLTVYILRLIHFI